MSAEAAATPLCEPGEAVGARIRAAVEASGPPSPCNTNLGIVLLAAPLLCAAERGAGPLRTGLREVLDRLTIADAVDAPTRRSGAPVQPGSAAPTRRMLGLCRRSHCIDAMRLAADRDLIARQYATGYAEVFETGVARVARSRLASNPPHWTATLVFLDFLCAFPDSHIARKLGTETAEQVRAEAAQLRRLTATTTPRPLFRR